MTRYYEMTTYEWHEPCKILDFQFQISSFFCFISWIGSANRSMYTLRTLFGLDICSVCGSYQCPYCPYYARSLRTQISLFIIIFAVIFCIIVKLFLWCYFSLHIEKKKEQRNLKQFSLWSSFECYLNKRKNCLKAMQVLLFITCIFNVRIEIEYLFVMMGIECSEFYSRF
jgi:nitric oxide reductase large subunit